MIKITSLTKRYPNDDKNTIKPLTMTLPNTGLVTIVGKSGSGKSTLLRILGSMDLDYEGSVTYNGMELKKLSEKELSTLRFQEFGYAFQSDEFDLKATVFESLKWPLEIEDIPLPLKENIIKEALRKVGLLGKSSDKIGSLSGGERKRVGIARAILSSPRVIFLDEPLSSIDDENKDKMITLFQSLARDSLLIMVTHYEKEIEGETKIHCKDGVFKVIKDNRSIYGVSKVRRRGRQKYSFLARFVKSTKTLKRNLTRSMLAISSLSVGLTCFGLSFFVSTSVNKAVKESLAGSLNSRSMLITKEQEENVDDTIRGSEISVSESLLESFPETIAGIGNFYLGNFETLFDNKNDCFIKIGTKTLNFGSLSVRDFINPSYPYELSDCEFKGETKKDEVVLALNPADYRSLSSLLDDDIDKYLANTDVILTLTLGASSMKYETECLFKIVAVYENDESKVVVNNHDWNRQFLEEELKLSPLNSIEVTPSKPWEVGKCSFVSIRPNEFLNFYSQFAKASEYESFLVEKADGFDDRYLVLVDNERRLKSSEVFEIYDSYPGSIDNYTLSNSLFGFVSDGRYNGFSKPLFLSSERESLNTLADTNYESQGGDALLQTSGFELEEGVYKCDLLTAMDGKGVIFEGYDAKPKLLSGEYPGDSRSILISSRLAIELFANTYDALFSKVQGLVLTGVIYRNGRYINEFKDVTFLVSGIVESEELKFYQDPLFPSAFMLEQCGINGIETRYDGAIINFASSVDQVQILESVIASYPSLLFSFPGKVLEEGVDEVIYYINAILLFFATLSTFIAIALLVLSLFLSISEDHKTIGLYLIQGYLRKEIFSYYLVLVGMMIGLGVLLSYLNLLVISIVCGEAFDTTLNIDGGLLSLEPFVAILLLALFSYLISTLFVLTRLKTISPLEELMKR